MSASGLFDPVGDDSPLGEETDRNIQSAANRSDSSGDPVPDIISEAQNRGGTVDSSGGENVGSGRRRITGGIIPPNKDGVIMDFETSFDQIPTGVFPPQEIPDIQQFGIEQAQPSVNPIYGTEDDFIKMLWGLPNKPQGYFPPQERLDQPHREDWESMEWVKKSLFLAGFYDSSAEIERELATPGMTNETLQAARRFFDFASTQDEEPWYNVLNALVDAGGIEGLDSSGDDQKRPPIQVSLSDPAGLAQGITQVYRQIVGENPSQKEKRAFIAAIHQAQRSQQIAQQEARYRAQTEEGEVVETEGVDVQARAEEFAREQRPVESGARDVVGAQNVLRDLIRGGG